MRYTVPLLSSEATLGLFFGLRHMFLLFFGGSSEAVKNIKITELQKLLSTVMHTCPVISSHVGTLFLVEAHVLPERYSQT